MKVRKTLSATETRSYNLSNLAGYLNRKLFYYDEFYDPPCVRSVKCTRLTVSEKGVCAQCQHLKKDKHFLLMLRRKSRNKDQRFTNDNYCSHKTLCARLKRLRSRVSTYKFSELVMHKKLKVLTKVKETLSSVMAEATVRQDQQSLFYNLKVAQQKGYLRDKKTVLSFLTDISSNIRRKANGKRYTEALKDFYSWIRIKGGPRVVKFMQENLDGPGKL